MKRFFLLLFVMIFCITGKLFSATLTIIYDDGNKIEIGTSWDDDSDIDNYDYDDEDKDYEDSGSQFTLNGSHLTLVDANSDGYMDIMEEQEWGGRWHNSLCNLYIYNPKEKKLELEIEKTFNLQFEGNGIISDSYYESLFGGHSTYKWDGNHFRELFSHEEHSFHNGYGEIGISADISYSWDEGNQKTISEKYKYHNKNEEIEITKEEYEKLKSEIYDDSTW